MYPNRFRFCLPFPVEDHSHGQIQMNAIMPSLRIAEQSGVRGAIPAGGVLGCGCYCVVFSATCCTFLASSHPIAWGCVCAVVTLCRTVCSCWRCSCKRHANCGIAVAQAGPGPVARVCLTLNLIFARTPLCNGLFNYHCGHFTMLFNSVGKILKSDWSEFQN